ncbi:hypothetical protein BaRGS_00005724 [Batillaria attramentaria]|uniref:Uncharacterized protein n=1 Tax=Batillaria attramentaria TaxID=370345 RepID=A0ABD0LV52_9CAEN
MMSRMRICIRRQKPGAKGNIAGGWRRAETAMENRALVNSDGDSLLIQRRGSVSGYTRTPALHAGAKKESKQNGLLLGLGVSAYCQLREKGG